MKTNALAERSAIMVAGIAATENHLAIPPNITDEQDAALMHGLKKVAKGAPWWIGDYALARRGRKGQHYAKPLAECWGVTEHHICDAVRIADFFKVVDRSTTLTWMHHREALRGAGGIEAGDHDRAMMWLAKAERNEWDVSELRAAINTERALPAGDDDPGPEANPYDALDEADKWATHNMCNLDALDKDRATTLLVRIQSLAHLVDRLRAIAGITAFNAAHLNEKFTRSIATAE